MLSGTKRTEGAGCEEVNMQPYMEVTTGSLGRRDIDSIQASQNASTVSRLIHLPLLLDNFFSFSRIYNVTVQGASREARVH